MARAQHRRARRRPPRSAAGGGAYRREGRAPLAIELLAPDAIAVVTTSPVALGAVAWGCDGNARVYGLAARFPTTKAAFDRFHPVPGRAAYYRLVSDATSTVVADCP